MIIVYHVGYMSKLEVYKYSELGWSRWLFGPFFLLVGLGLWWVEYGQIRHSIANHNGTSVWLWLAFAIVGLVFVTVGDGMLASQRENWIEGRTWQSKWGWGFKWTIHTYYKDEIRGFVVTEQPIIAVFGNRATTMGRRYLVSGLLHVRKWSRPIALCATKEEAEKICDRFEREVGSTPKLEKL